MIIQASKDHLSALQISKAFRDPVRLLPSSLLRLLLFALLPPLLLLSFLPLLLPLCVAFLPAPAQLSFHVMRRPLHPLFSSLQLPYLPLRLLLFLRHLQFPFASLLLRLLLLLFFRAALAALDRTGIRVARSCRRLDGAALTAFAELGRAALCLWRLK